MLQDLSIFLTRLKMAVKVLILKMLNTVEHKLSTYLYSKQVMVAWLVVIICWAFKGWYEVS
jgi:hypothetical protein